VKASAAAVLGALALALTSAAGAQPTPATAQAQQQAKENYDRGVMAYNLERFDEAIAAFTRAYELDPAPILLFNIAQSRWKKGESERAVFYYRRYLEAAPDAPNRAQVEARIRDLEAAPSRAPEPASARVPNAPPAYVQERAAPPPGEPRPLYRRAWFWGAVGAAVVGAAVTVLLLSSRGTPGPACSAADCNLGMVPVPRP
jgi:tetratricopeptide (TPR) repeat protein